MIRYARGTCVLAVLGCFNAMAYRCMLRMAC